MINDLSGIHKGMRPQIEALGCLQLPQFQAFERVSDCSGKPFLVRRAGNKNAWNAKHDSAASPEGSLQWWHAQN